MSEGVCTRISLDMVAHSWERVHGTVHIVDTQSNFNADQSLDDVRPARDHLDPVPQCEQAMVGLTEGGGLSVLASFSRYRIRLISHQ